MRSDGNLRMVVAQRLSRCLEQTNEGEVRRANPPRSSRGGRPPNIATPHGRDEPGEVVRALRVRAALGKRVVEAAVRAILRDVVLPMNCVKLGSLLPAIGKEIQLTDQELVNFERNRTPHKAVTFD